MKRLTLTGKTYSRVPLDKYQKCSRESDGRVVLKAMSVEVVRRFDLMGAQIPNQYLGVLPKATT